MACLSHSLDIVFHRADVFNFNEVHIIISFLNHVFDVISKMTSPYPRSFRFFPMLYSRGFISLYFTFRSKIHFKLIFLKGIMSVSRFVFFVCRCSVVLASFVEEAICSVELPLLLCQNSVDYI